MSDLKHRNIEQLKKAERDCEKYIGQLQGKINNQQTRLVWIRKYLRQKITLEHGVEAAVAEGYMDLQEACDAVSDCIAQGLTTPGFHGSQQHNELRCLLNRLRIHL